VFSAPGDGLCDAMVICSEIPLMCQDGQAVVQHADLVVQRFPCLEEWFDPGGGHGIEEHLVHLTRYLCLGVPDAEDRTTGPAEWGETTDRYLPDPRCDVRPFPPASPSPVGI